MHTTYVRMQLDRQRAEARHRRLQRHHSKAKAVRAKLADCCRALTSFFFTQVLIDSPIGLSSPLNEISFIYYIEN